MPFAVFRMPFTVFPMPFPFFPSTKSAFLCAFGVWNPYFRPFRAQNRGFCAYLAFGTPVFGHFEHKIEVFVRFLAFGTPVFGLFEHRIGIFVRFCPSEPSFSGFSSTKSAFLCSFAEVRHQVAIGKAQLRLSAPSGSHTLPLRDQGCAHFSFCLRCHEAVIVYLCVL